MLSPGCACELSSLFFYLNSVSPVMLCFTISSSGATGLTNDTFQCLWVCLGVWACDSLWMWACGDSWQCRGGEEREEDTSLHFETLRGCTVQLTEGQQGQPWWITGEAWEEPDCRGEMWHGDKSTGCRARARGQCLAEDLGAEMLLALDVETEANQTLKQSFRCPIRKTMTAQLEPRQKKQRLYYALFHLTFLFFWRARKHNGGGQNIALLLRRQAGSGKKSSHTEKLLLCMSAVLCCCMATVSTEIFAQKHSSLVFT